MMIILRSTSNQTIISNKIESYDFHKDCCQLKNLLNLSKFKKKKNSKCDQGMQSLNSLHYASSSLFVEDKGFVSEF